MSKYRKLVAAVVGLVVLVAGDFLGVADAAQLEEPLVNGVVAFLTLVGVWAAPNDG